ncbi:ATP-binding cassette domain-containing protein [Epibacterium sp. SM1979]|uniref:ATP-binding cassette domain-containing protein n=1 Tax=Tritonibacter litoralis TaxID=2662264 RepID=A0A843YNF3_9RHOB|nr:ABC transporter ATP-binding protein [Tritonibacter litoralis]MQQ10157.1 ATP-binding cassette domain-containing protein [Tritonibacter litoralis]
MPQITLSNITKTYAGSNAPAVRNVNLTVEDGAFMCVLGPSGCGKSTILRMISGLETLTEGEIAVDGRALDNVATGQFVPPEKRGIGLVFQSYALWPHMTVAANIEFGLKLQNMPTKARKARVAEMVKTLRIEGLEDRYPAQLSGGQQQRVALARTLAVTPGILLLDEPLSNLDATLRLSMRAELSRLHREFGTTIVFVTHDQWEAMTLATQIAVMSKGELQQIGTPDDIYARPANRFVAEFIGNPPINLIPASSSAAQVLISAAPTSLADVAMIGLRPEGMVLNTTDGPGALPVVISEILPTGGAWMVEVTYANGQTPAHLTHTTQSPPPWRVGDAVFLHPQPHALHAFDHTGTRQALPGQTTPTQTPLLRASAGEAL